MATIFKSLFWVVVLVCALFIGYLSRAYIIGPVESFRLQPDEGEFIAFRLHAIGGVTALVIGPLQFVAAIRRRVPQVHRWLGRIYVAAVAIGATGALVMAASPIGSPANSFAFWLLAILWVLSTAQALRYAIFRKIAAHKKWILRSYAFTFAAVTLRLGIPALIFGFGYAEPEAYGIAAWASWTINLVVVEWFLLPTFSHNPEGD